MYCDAHPTLFAEASDLYVVAVFKHAQHLPLAVIWESASAPLLIYVQRWLRKERQCPPAPLARYQTSFDVRHCYITEPYIIHLVACIGSHPYRRNLTLGGALQSTASACWSIQKAGAPPQLPPKSSPRLELERPVTTSDGSGLIATITGLLFCCIAIRRKR